jgi:hypothetical protein
MKLKIYNGKYLISDDGRVFSIYFKNRHLNFERKEPKQLKTCIGSNGYEYTTVCFDGVKKTIFIHQMVCKLFVNGYFDGAITCHIDGNRLNNSAKNLKWATYKENQADRIIHGTDHRGSKNVLSKLTEAQVFNIHKLSKKQTGAAIAKQYGVCRDTVYAILKGKNWKHVYSELKKGK